MRKKKEFREELKTFFPNEEIYSSSRPLILFLSFHYIWNELLLDTFLYFLISLDKTTKFRIIVMLKKFWILNKILRILCWYFTIRVFLFIRSKICRGNGSIRQDEEYFYQQTGLKFEEKDIEMLHLSLTFKELELEHFGTRSEILWKFWNMVSEKIGDQLERSYEEEKFSFESRQKGIPYI